MLVKEITRDFSNSYLGVGPKDAGELVASIHRVFQTLKQGTREGDRVKKAVQRGKGRIEGT